MTLLVRFILCLNVIFYFNAATLNFAIAADINLENQVTIHEPKTRISDLKDRPEGKGGNWLWALLGAVAVAGGIAAIAGGDSGGGDDSGDDGPTTGSVGGSW
jgi:hypothetical protein